MKRMFSFFVTLWLGVMGASAQSNKYDLNHDGYINTTDVIVLVDYIFDKDNGNDGGNENDSISIGSDNFADGVNQILNNSVLFTPQSKTDAEKSTARSNIGAASINDIPDLSPFFVDRATIDYGILSGYREERVSGGTYTLTSTDTGVHMEKNESVNSYLRFNLPNVPKSSLHFKYKSDKNLPNIITLYIDRIAAHSVNVPENTKEYEFDYDFNGNGVLGAGYQIKYNVSSVDLAIEVYDNNASGLAVVADDISERVEELEEAVGVIDPIPHIIETENTFIGTNAGIHNQRGGGEDIDDGRYNTAVGKSAFEQNTLGDHCTAVGFCALRYNTTGNNNTAVGEDAMYENRTGSQNVALGQHTGQDNRNGGYNVYIGSNAARRLASGNLNVIIGAEACNNENTTRMNGCIMIGSYVPNRGNYDNVINIGGNTPSQANQIIIGKGTHTSVIIAGKIIKFNQDGTVTWESVSSPSN